MLCLQHAGQKCYVCVAVQVKPEWPDKPGMVARRAHCDTMAAKQLEALPAGSR